MGAVRDDADAGRVDEDAVAFAPIHDLRVAGHQLHACLGRRPLHRLHDAPQRLHRQAFFQDEACAQEARPRAAHRQVVHRAVDGQRADVAAGKEQRPHDVGIGRERQAAGARLEDRAVVPRVEPRLPNAGTNIFSMS